MKRVLLKALSIALIICLIATLYGCTGSGNETSSNTSSNVLSTTTNVSQSASSAISITAPDITVSYERVSSSAQSWGGTSSATAPLYTPSSPDPNYAFDGSISFAVLNRYLDRAMTFSALFWQKDLDEHIRMFKNLGIKYIPRVSAEWHPGSFEQERGDELKAMVDKIHYADPDIIVEACIFECVTKQVEMIKIPTHVQEAFGETVRKNRFFDLEKMTFDKGDSYVNHWGDDQHVPDITKLETQMFFYTRACEYIDLGYESIHLGQANMIGKNDKNNECWTKVIKMIRAYAKKNARRHYVLINAHTKPTEAFEGTDGVMLVDFNAYPTRMHAAEGQTDHLASEDNPQKCTIGNHPWDAVYKQGISGKHPSGWYTDKYPYLVEFDNGSIAVDIFGKATHTFGYDEISWYANQPYSYRKEFMEYLYKEIKSYKENGHIALPGSRGLAASSVTTGGIYFANSKSHLQKGWGDEGFFKELLETYAK